MNGLQLVRRRDVVRLVGAGGLVSIAGCQGLTTGDSDPDCDDSIPDEPRLEVPETTVGDPLTVDLAGIEPNEEVTLEVTFEDDGGHPYAWRTDAETDECGIAESFVGGAPEAGAITGVDGARMPIGRFEFDGDYDRTGSSRPSVSRSELELAVSVRRGDESIASTTARRTVSDSEIEPRRIEAEELVGWYYEPTGEGPHPAVLVLHGSEGTANYVREFAHRLASSGYASLALQYFGAGELPSELVEIPLEYFDRAIEWLHGRDAVRSDWIGTMGHSRGVEPAIFAAASFSGAATAVGYVGSGVVERGLREEPDGFDAAWTRDGEPIPTEEEFLAFWEADASIEVGEYEDLNALCSYAEPTKPCDPIGDAYDGLRSEVPDACEAMLAPVDRVDGPVALLSGRDDSLWPSAFYSEWALARLEDVDHDHPYAHHAFEDAGHWFGLPYDHDSAAGHGGSTDGNARAAVRSWALALEYFEAGLP